MNVTLIPVLTYQGTVVYVNPATVVAVAEGRITRGEVIIHMAAGPEITLERTTAREVARWLMSDGDPQQAYEVPGQ